MAEMALDDNATYVLTEDMIDAAMYQQLSYQDGIESEECSQDEEMIFTVISPSVDEHSSTESNDSPSKDVAPTEDCADNNNVRTVECDRTSTSVLVIETGLNSTVLNGPSDNNTMIERNNEIIPVPSSSQHCSSNSGGSWHDSVTKTSARDAQEVVEVNPNLNAKELETDKAPILATMLKETPKTLPVNVCEMETTSDVSEESMDQDAVDSELQSVMESNLMAEVGITAHQIREQVDSSAEEPLKVPKISVRSISQISSSVFNSLPDNLDESEEFENNNSQSTSGVNKMIKVAKERNELKPVSLHLNDIAVPNNETFVNKQGEVMRCVYLKNNERPILPRDTIFFPAANPLIEKTQPTNNYSTLSKAGMKIPPTRKPLIIGASNRVSNNLRTQQNLYQTHRLIPIVSNQTVPSKSNFKLVSTIQQANFDSSKTPTSVNNPQLRQKPSESQREVYLPDVLLAPETPASKVINANKPNMLYESGASTMNGNPPSALKLVQKPAQNITPGANRNVAYPRGLPVLRRIPQVNVSVALEINPLSIHQYNNDLQSIIKSLLFHNLKKTYTPPEPHPCMEKLTYNCPDCSDRFIFEKNLAEHLARKTMAIRYMCKLCSSELQFYNRCLLFKHLRMHNNSIKDLDFTCIQISELPKELIDKGIVSSCLKSSANLINLQRHERILKNSKYRQWQATDIEANRPFKSIMSVDKSYNQQVSLPTVSKVTPYAKRNNSTSFTSVVLPNRPLTQAVTSPQVVTVPVQGAPSPTFTPDVASTCTFTPLSSSAVLTPVIASTTSFASTVHPTYTMVPTTSSAISTTSGNSPVIQKLPHQLAKQKKSAPPKSKKSLLINKSHNQNLNPSQSSKVIFLSKVPAPKSHVVRVSNQEQNSVFKVPSTDYVSKYLKVESRGNRHLSTSASQPVLIDPRAQQSDKSIGKVKETTQDDTVIDIDVEEEIEQSVVEVVDVENDWTNNRDGSMRNNSALVNGRNSPKPVTSKTYKRNCSECGVSCSNIGKHLNGNGRPSRDPAMECQTCNLILPTRCAFKVHLRIHSKTPPFKCPDCGKDFTAWEEYYAHLKYSCGHLAKCLRYFCLSCKDHFPSKEMLEHHLETKHSRVVYRCQFCPVAFYTSEALRNHFPKKHPDQECVPQVNHRTCSICSKKVVELEKFKDHMEYHIRSSNAMNYGYNCSMCALIFLNKMAFVIHQLEEKEKNKKIPEKKKSLPVSTKDRHQSVVGAGGESPLAYNSSNFVTDDSETDEPIIGVVEKDPLSLDDWEVQKINNKPQEHCIICKKTNIAPNSTSSCCKNCVCPVNSPISIDEYTKSLGLSPSNPRAKPCPKSKKRSVSPDETGYESKKPKSINSMSRNSSKSSEYEYVGGSSSSQNIPTTKKKKNRKKLNKPEQVKRLFEGKIMPAAAPAQLVCSQCENFSGSTKEEFLEHIKGHKTEPNWYQCQECGLCFVVLPSLERHLQMYHQIKNFADYAKENQACMPQISDPVEERLDLEENECPVCREKFENKLIFEKHFRGHGRAFMNSLSK